MNESVFIGDVRLTLDENGADIIIKDGLIQDCRDFDTAVMLSLFGGNKDDENGMAKKTWWGNLIPGTRREEWMQSEFAAMITGYPMTGVNLRKASNAATRDLAWAKNIAGADSVSVSLYAENQDRIKLTAEIMQEKQSAGGGSYELQWQEAVR